MSNFLVTSWPCLYFVVAEYDLCMVERERKLVKYVQQPAVTLIQLRFVFFILFFSCTIREQVVYYSYIPELTSTRRNDNPTRFSIVSRFLDTATYLVAIKVIYVVERLCLLTQARHLGISLFTHFFFSFILLLFFFSFFLRIK